ncbi:MAG: PepSY domain-containing protein [Anaerolineales bacterium]|jgi:uncharacterized membrane protein YkoI
MNQKLTIVLAASITAFVLILTGAIISWSTQPASAAGAAQVADVYAQRETEYQSRLEEANAALEQAYAQQSASVQAQADSAASLQAAVTPEQALQVAALRAPTAQLLKSPELVLFQGTLAYEVSLDKGMIYVDANTGALLYDGTAQVQNTSQARSYDHDDDYGEHERYDDD